MPSTRTMIRAFSGGEIAPEMLGRLDDAKYQSGAETLLNMVCKPTGPARKRPGFRFVAEVKDSTKKVRLLTFTASAGDESVDIIVEMGAGYFRFHQDGGPVLLGSQPRDYVGNATFAAASTPINVVTGEITTGSAHTFQVNDPIIFTRDPGGTLPTGLTPLITYYVKTTASTTKMIVSLTVGGAAVIPSDQGVATNRINYAYVEHDKVYSLSTGSNWVCLQSPVIDGAASVIPGGGATYWHELSRNIYEIPNPFIEANLPFVGIDPARNLMTLCHPDHGNFELTRDAATEWTFDDITFGGVLDAPAQPTVTPTRGATLTLVSSTAATPADFVTSFTHGIAPGDGVYVFDALNTVPGAFVPDGFYQAGSATTGAALTLMTQANGAAVVPTGTYNPNSGRVHIIGLQTLATHLYKVTAVDDDGLESEASAASATATNNLSVPGSYNTISWAAVSGAARYRVYKEQTGLYGFIGETEALTFRDDNIAPDLGGTPPVHDDILNSNAARCTAHFEQRRCFAAPDAYPDVFFATRTGTDTDLAYHIPLLDDDRIAAQVASSVPCVLMHIVPMAQLVLLSETAEYRVSPVNSDALTPTSIAIRPQSYIGSSHVRPIVVNSTLLFFAARGGHVREMGFRQDVESFVTADVSVRASHLFEGLTIVDAAYCKAPLPITWACSSNGDLLGFTYLPEEQVYGWHHHNSVEAGTFESCTRAIEGDEDALYVEVKRTINGGTKRYIERMDEFARTAREDSFFVDSGLTYDSTPATTIRNLTHLDTETVAVLADGAPLSSTVTRLAAQTCTFDGTTNIVTAAAHGLIAGEQVTFLNSGGALPIGIPSATILLARDITTDTFKVEYSSGFGAINFVGNGSGTNTVRGSGRITLTTAASVIQAGLPFTGRIKSLPFTQEIDGASGASIQKNVNRAWVRTVASGGFEVGPDDDLLASSDPRSQFTDTLRSADIEVTLPGDWTDGGQIIVESADPLPLEVTAVVLEVAIGD